MDQRLISVFQDTQRLLWENELLCRLTSQAVMCTQVYPENFDTTRVVGAYPMGVSVTEETALQAAGRQAYPYAQVYCSTLCYGTFGENNTNPFPTAKGMNQLAQGWIKSLEACENINYFSEKKEKRNGTLLSGAESASDWQRL